MLAVALKVDKLQSKLVDGEIDFQQKIYEYNDDERDSHKMCLSIKRFCQCRGTIYLHTVPSLFYYDYYLYSKRLIVAN